ncbi:hypothetical protein ABT391_31760 [Streptomyces jumonjinensis]|uniref:hypothetical protein n=1 Tax=Streptomyces jumonjinensis TaxID=1945 RepID=UPI0033345A32
MYLVHIHLRSPANGEALTRDIAAVVMAAGLEAGLEHVTVHTGGIPCPVIGIYVRAATLRAAEALAKEIWSRASDTDRRLSRWVPLRIEVPLLVPPEWLT